MSWREIEGKKVVRVQPVDSNEVVLELEGGELVKIRASHPSNAPESEAELVIEIKKAKT
jgi:hypothetical protein